MKKSRFSEEKIVGILREAQGGMKVKEVCARHNISEQTYYGWKRRYGGMQVDEVRQARALAEENARLRSGFRGRPADRRRSPVKGPWVRIPRPAHNEGRSRRTGLRCVRGRVVGRGSTRSGPSPVTCRGPPGTNTEAATAADRRGSEGLGRTRPLMGPVDRTVGLRPLAEPHRLLVAGHPHREGSRIRPGPGLPGRRTRCRVPPGPPPWWCAPPTATAAPPLRTPCCAG